MLSLHFRGQWQWIMISLFLRTSLMLVLMDANGCQRAFSFLRLPLRAGQVSGYKERVHAVSAKWGCQIPTLEDNSGFITACIFGKFVSWNNVAPAAGKRCDLATEFKINEKTNSLTRFVRAVYFSIKWKADAHETVRAYIPLESSVDQKWNHNILRHDLGISSWYLYYLLTALTHLLQ